MKTQEPTSGAVALFFGPQPMDFLGKAIKVCGKTAVLDQDVARMAGAMTAVGMPEHLALLRKRLEAGALQAEREKRGGIGPVIPGAIEWLAHGQRGASSEALFTRLSGINATRGATDGVAMSDHPYDPADLRRCRLMLEKCPALLPTLKTAAGMSKEWAALIAIWDELCATMDAETPDWRDGSSGRPALKTYAMIKEAIGR